MSSNRILITAPSSGSGKTLITCGILQALKNRGINIASFKCGPDYIDPMFHEKVLGKSSINLDTFFADEETVNYLLKSHSEESYLSVIEGVMGYYDGIAGISADSSAYDVAIKTKTPAVMIINGKGVSLSMLPQIKGFLDFKNEVSKNSNIQGVIINKVSPMFYPRMKNLIEKELGIKVLGYVENLPNLTLESRYLGLVMPNEIENIKSNLEKFAEILERTLDLDEFIKIAETAPEIKVDVHPKLYVDKVKTRVAVAKDEAFSFMYKDNLELIEKLGGEIVYFSPIRDSSIPKNVGGLILSGGYPELYAKELSENTSMIQSIKTALENNMPCIAECGGFMYLHEEMEDNDREKYTMVGAIKGKAFKTEKLGRFGYITLNEGMAFGEDVGELPAHEFHYFDSTSCGEEFHAVKPQSKINWRCIHAEKNLFAGFPHLYFYGNVKFPIAFLNRCKEYYEIR